MEEERQLERRDKARPVKVYLSPGYFLYRAHDLRIELRGGTQDGLTGLRYRDLVVCQNALHCSFYIRHGLSGQNPAIHFCAGRLREGVYRMATLQHGCHASRVKLCIIKGIC